jgi:GTPase SAR1 family protein
MYCRGSAVALIVFDLSDEQSFAEVDSWYSQVTATAPNECAVIIVGNKLDLPPAVAPEKITDWANRHRVKYAAVSALDGTGVQELFRQVADSLVKQATTPKMETMRQATNNAQPCC